MSLALLGRPRGAGGHGVREHLHAAIAQPVGGQVQRGDHHRWGHEQRLELLHGRPAQQVAREAQRGQLCLLRHRLHQRCSLFVALVQRDHRAFLGRRRLALVGRAVGIVGSSVRDLQRQRHRVQLERLRRGEEGRSWRHCLDLGRHDVRPGRDERLVRVGEVGASLEPALRRVRFKRCELHLAARSLLRGRPLP